MNPATWLIVGLALALIIVAYLRGDGSLATGLKSGWKMLVGLLLLLVAVFVVGLSNALLLREAIAGWLGVGARLKGILIASGIGAIMPGGSFVSFSLVATLSKAGAKIGPLVVFSTA